MSDNKLIPFVVVTFIRFTIELMLSTGLLLKEAVANAPPLPALFNKVWDKFFASIDRLLRASVKDVPIYEIPEVARAIDETKDAIRGLSGVFTAGLHSRNADVREAAENLVMVFFPDGLDIVMNKQHHVIGWAMMTIESIKVNFADDLVKVRAQLQFEEMEEALRNYQKVAGRFIDPDAVDVPMTKKEMLDDSRVELQGVMLDLSYAVRHHPEYRSAIAGMLRPLVEVTEKVRADLKKAKADNADDTTSDDDTASDDTSDEETEAEEEAEAEEEETEETEGEEVEETEDEEVEAESDEEEEDCED